MWAYISWARGAIPPLLGELVAAVQGGKRIIALLETSKQYDGVSRSKARELLLILRGGLLLVGVQPSDERGDVLREDGLHARDQLDVNFSLRVLSDQRVMPNQHRSPRHRRGRRQRLRAAGHKI